MSKIIAENLLQSKQLLNNPTPTWSGFITATFASGASAVTGTSYGAVPHTGDYVNFTTSAGASGSFVVATVSSSGTNTKTFSITPTLTGGIPRGMSGGSTVIEGYRSGVNGGQSRMLVVKTVDTGSYVVRALSSYVSTGDALRYVTTTGSTGETVISTVSSGSQIVGNYYERTVTLSTGAINTGTYLFQDQAIPVNFSEVIADRYRIRY